MLDEMLDQRFVKIEILEFELVIKFKFYNKTARATGYMQAEKFEIGREKLTLDRNFCLRQKKVRSQWKCPPPHQERVRDQGNCSRKKNHAVIIVVFFHVRATNNKLTIHAFQHVVGR